MLGLRSCLAAFALLMAAGTARLAYLVTVPCVSAAELRSRVEAELPLGTTRAEVEAWLQRQGLPFDDVLDGPGGRPVGLSGTIESIYRVSLLGNTDIDFEFSFDENNRLIEFSVREFTFCL